MIRKLEARLEKKESGGGGKRVSGFVRFKRVPSQPLLTNPPPNAPTWAIEVSVKSPIGQYELHNKRYIA